MKKSFTLILTSLSLLVLTGCNSPTKTSKGAAAETAATEKLLDQASIIVGIPAIINFSEKKQLKLLYELRDNANLVTYSYYVDLNGNRHKICPTVSIGFGLPFSAQFTAPTVDIQAYATNGSTTITKHQPEPNGLYMPDSTSATWVICLGDDETLNPVYVEPQIIVSLTPMEG